MLRILFCFSCCQANGNAYKRSIRTVVSKRNEKLTEVANFDDIIVGVNEDLKKQRKLSNLDKYNEERPRDELDAPVSVKVISGAEFVGPDKSNTNKDFMINDLALSSIIDSLDFDDEQENRDKIKEYARIEYSPLPEFNDESSMTIEADPGKQTTVIIESDQDVMVPPPMELLSSLDKIEIPSKTGIPLTHEPPSLTQQVAKPPRPSVETIEQQQQRMTSHHALGSPTLTESASSLMSFDSFSIPSNMGGGTTSRTSWDTMGEGLDDFGDDDKDGMNYDHEFICSRLDEIFNQQISLLNIDSSELAYENIAIIIAYDKTDARNNNRLICFATSKATSSFRSDDLNRISLIDMRAATMARRALLLYLYKEIEIINANNTVSGEVLSSDAYLLERAYHMNQPKGYRVKKNIGLSMYLDGIGPNGTQLLNSQQQPSSRPSSRASFEAPSEQERLDSGHSEQRFKDDSSNSVPILRLKSIYHKICLWNVLGLQGSLLGMMVEPIYLDHIILGQVDDLKKLKTLQSKSAQSGLSAHANKPYKLNKPKLILWRDDCLSAYKSIRISTQAQTVATTATLAINDQDNQDEAYDCRHVNSLNWTYHDYVSDHAAELLDVRTGTVRSSYVTSALDDEDGSSDLREIAAGSRLSKATMMAQLIRIMMSNDSMSSLLFEGHNGGKFFDKMELGTRITYRALKNLAYQYNYVKYLCSPIFMNDLRVAAGGVDWVSSFDKVKNYEDQISFKVLPMDHSPTSMGMVVQLKEDEKDENENDGHRVEEQDNIASVELLPTTTDVSDITTKLVAPILEVASVVGPAATSVIGTDKMNDELVKPVMAKEHQDKITVVSRSFHYDGDGGSGGSEMMTHSQKGQKQREHLPERSRQVDGDGAEDGDGNVDGEDEEERKQHQHQHQQQQQSAFALASSSYSSSSVANASSNSPPNIVVADKLASEAKLPDNSLANLSTPSSLISYQSAPPTPTPSEVSSTKSKSKSKTKALLKKWRPGKKKKKEPSPP